MKFEAAPARIPAVTDLVAAVAALRVRVDSLRP